MNYEIKNAVISDAVLDCGDRGLLTGWLHLDYGGSGQGFGGTVLYLPKSFDHYSIESPAGHWIFRVMEVAGVSRWQDLPGKTVRVKSDWNHVSAIGHIIKDDWFCPENDFAMLTKRKKGEVAVERSDLEYMVDQCLQQGIITMSKGRHLLGFDSMEQMREWVNNYKEAKNE